MSSLFRFNLLIWIGGWFLLAFPVLMSEKLPETPGIPALENEILRVEMDHGFPRVLSYELKQNGGRLEGSSKTEGNVIEINGTSFSQYLDSVPAPLTLERTFNIESVFKDEEARYRFRVFETYGVLSFDVVFRLESNALVMRLESLSEQGDFRLYTLYFPNHSLLSVNASEETASAFRVEFLRTSWDQPKGKGLIRWKRVFNGPLNELVPDSKVEPTHWAMVSTHKVVGILFNNIDLFPVHTLVEGTPDSVRSLSMWNAPFRYRIDGEQVDPLESRVVLVQDQNGDGKTNWIDGALEIRSRIPTAPPAYDNAFVYKIFCARLPDPRYPETMKKAPEPTVYTTFEQALDLIRRIAFLTNGRPQIVYLVGWQHQGHDDKWPDLSVANPHLGGMEGLLSLMREAKRWNATVSFHLNIDDSYPSSPSWEASAISRKINGEMMDWQVFHGEMSYHISHVKDVSIGGAVDRFSQFLNAVPVEKSVHIDAMRYSNESWEADRFIDMAAEFHAWKKISGILVAKGISITTEGVMASPAFVGHVAGFWHLPGKIPGIEQIWFLLHRRWAAGGTKSAERAVFGNSRDRDITASTPTREVVEGYYLDTLLQQYLYQFEATDFSDDGKVLTVIYGRQAEASFDRQRGLLRVVSQEAPVAVGTDRFIPVSKTEILAYSREGGNQEWRIPAGMPDDNWSMKVLTEEGCRPGPRVDLAAGALSFEAEPGQPYLLISAGSSDTCFNIE